MPYRYRFNSKRRDALWAAECFRAHVAGAGSLPICNLCGRPVSTTEKWHESHDPARPRCFGGRAVGVAHRVCNLQHGARVVVPAIAKAKRLRSRHAVMRERLALRTNDGAPVGAWAAPRQ
jgi:hypothetical protein